MDGLRPATAYALRLAAVNAIGDSDYTEPVIVQTLEEGKEIITDAIHYWMFYLPIKLKTIGLCDIPLPVSVFSYYYLCVLPLEYFHFQHHQNHRTTFKSKLLLQASCWWNGRYYIILFHQLNMAVYSCFERHQQKKQKKTRKKYLKLDFLPTYPKKRKIKVDINLSFCHLHDQD